MNFKPLLLSVIIMSFYFFSSAQDIADVTIKKNISPIESPMEKLSQLSPKSYHYDYSNFKYLKLQPGLQYGFIAEDLEAIFPNLVKEKSVPYMFGKNVYRNVRIKVIDESSLIPVMVAAIKEQQAEIENLRNALQELKKEMAIAN